MVLLLLYLLHFLEVVLVVGFVLFEQYFALVFERGKPLVIAGFWTAVVATPDAGPCSFLSVTVILALIRLSLGLFVSRLLLVDLFHVVQVYLIL